VGGRGTGFTQGCGAAGGAWCGEVEPEGSLGGGRVIKHRSGSVALVGSSPYGRRLDSHLGQSHALLGLACFKACVQSKAQ
jgi:hypothetical protein